MQTTGIIGVIWGLYWGSIGIMVKENGNNYVGFKVWGVGLNREFSFGPLGFVPLGFGSLNHGIWPSIRVFGTQSLGVQTLRVQT